MSLLRFATYEDYLDEMVSPSDMRYIGDRTVARELISLGHHNGDGEGDILDRRKFELQREKERLENEGKESEQTSSPEDEFALLGLDDDDDCDDDDQSGANQLMRAVAEREDDMRRGILTPIVFVRRKDPKKSGGGREVSAFIDLAQRLKDGSLLAPSGDGAACNGGASNKKKRPRIRLHPRRDDLSFCDLRCSASSASASASSCGGGAVAGSSQNFESVILEGGKGGTGTGTGELAFRSKSDDSTIVRVDPDLLDGEEVGGGGGSVGVGRTLVKERGYEQIVFFDVYVGDGKGRGEEEKRSEHDDDEADDSAAVRRTGEGGEVRRQSCA